MNKKPVKRKRLGKKEFTRDYVRNSICFGYGEPTKELQGGTLRALSKTTGVTLWMRTLPVAITAGLAVDGVALFGASADGNVYAFDKRTGLVLWSTQYPEVFSAQPMVSGEHVYFGSKAGTLRALNVKTGEIVWQYKAAGAIRECRLSSRVSCISDRMTAMSMRIANQERNCAGIAGRVRRSRRSRSCLMASSLLRSITLPICCRSTRAR